uniref:Protein hairless n=1 Tax=Dendroctonus ponderosae TaxID=77166 RepID=A0AAR5P6I2_DENPD
MHIPDLQTSPNILTKCSKMTEESHRRHGMNGSVDRISKECHKANYGQGGRLKFFKDGKFILELERAREGERLSWVSVPRKTFWPPPGPATSTSAYRQESSTSLSVSDDNSSVQSSPWQRDHSWKQTTPKRNISQEMVLFFFRPKQRRGYRGSCTRRRRPLSTVEDKEEESDAVHEKKEIKEKRSLLSIVQSLIDKNCPTGTPPRPETVVSPRKRFLREMERERTPSASSSPTSDRPGSSDDGSSNSAQKRRVRSQPGPATPRTPPYPVIRPEKSETITPLNTPIRTNGFDESPVNNIKPSKNSSYSITSLLAEDHHKSSLKSSPSQSPNRFSPVVPQIASIPSSGIRYCPPITSEDRLYSESVDRLRSIELSQVEKCGYPATYARPPQQYLGPAPYMYSFPPIPPYYGPGAYGRPSAYMVTQPVYQQHSVHQNGPLPHSTHPLHSVAHLVPFRRDVPRPTSWLPDEVVRDRDESIADMPLNLSKHSG